GRGPVLASILRRRALRRFAAMLELRDVRTDFEKTEQLLFAYLFREIVAKPIDGLRRVVLAAVDLDEEFWFDLPAVLIENILAIPLLGSRRQFVSKRTARSIHQRE